MTAYQYLVADPTVIWNGRVYVVEVINHPNDHVNFTTNNFDHVTILRNFIVISTNEFIFRTEYD
jgi:hypothetical protein